jgi:hypothetical protein
LYLQHIANHLQDVFTRHKGVIKSYIPAKNVPERVEVPNKTTQLPNQNKRGRSTVTKDKASCKLPRKQRNPSSKTVNANQHQVDRHLMDIHYPNAYGCSTSKYPAQMCTQIQALGHGNTLTPLFWEIHGLKWDNISTNYIDSIESINIKDYKLSTNISPRKLQKIFNWIQAKVHGHGRVPQALGLDQIEGSN